jgi:hypothetical protein
MPVDLRPLGVGEIFDRAVTLYVRNFALFTIIAAFVVVPLTVVRYFVASSQAGAWAQVFDQIQHPSKHATATAGFSPWLYVLIVLALFLTPFMYVAIAAAVGRIYHGEATDWQSALRVSLRHAVGIIATVFSQIFVLILAVFAGSILLGILIGISVVLLRYMTPLGVVLSFMTAIYGIVFVCALMLCYLALALAFDAIGIEEVRFVRAFSSGFARVFNRREMGKALLICLAFIAVEIGVMIASLGVASLLEAAVHVPLLDSVVQGVLSLIATSFVGVLLAVYYFDVRIRSEGLDLQAELDRLQAQPQA